MCWVTVPTPGLLWNLSSTDELKEELIADALPVLADRVIIPFSGCCDGNSNLARETVDPEVFFNTTGCLRCVQRAAWGPCTPARALASPGSSSSAQRKACRYTWPLGPHNTESLGLCEAPPLGTLPPPLGDPADFVRNLRVEI